jgi:hypothetical protein
MSEDIGAVAFVVLGIGEIVRVLFRASHTT